MALDTQLLEILVCPDSKERVAPLSPQALIALNELIRAGKVRNRAGVLVEESLDAGLLRSDGKIVYPVRRDIPVMLVEEGLPVEGLVLLK